VLLDVGVIYVVVKCGVDGVILWCGGECYDVLVVLVIGIG